MKNTQVNVQSRQMEILRQLEKEGVLYVRDLSTQLGVTEITVRRDLARLEEQGKVERFHGGARLAQRASVEPSPSPRENIVATSLLSDHIVQLQLRDADKKNLICRKIASLIQNDEVLFMNSGTTLLYLPQYLSGKRTRIFSNNAAMAMVERPADTELTITGGEHFVRTQSMVGIIAKNTISSMIATKCILGVGGISADEGITTALYQETEINNLMINRCSGTRIVAAAPHKIGYTQSFITCSISDIDILVTLSTADAEEIRKIRNRGTKVIFADQPPDRE